MSHLYSFLKLPSFRSLLILIIVFLSSTIVGYRKAPEVVAEDSTFLGRPMKSLRDTPYVQVWANSEERRKKFWKFIFHNSITALVTLVAGTVCFAYPAVKMAVFGFVLGVLSWHVGSVDIFLKLMLPHSLTEIPTAFYYSVIAQNSGWKWLWAPCENRWACFKDEVISNLRLFVVVILPLVLLNALLEAYVTNT